MGYIRKEHQTIYKLEFSDPQFEGLEVRTIAIATDKLLAIQELGSSNSAQREDLEKICELFEEAILSWNVEEEVKQKDGTLITVPVPPTKEGLLKHDPLFIVQLINAWQKNVAGVAEDLKAELTDGLPLEAPPIPMEMLSKNPES